MIRVRRTTSLINKHREILGITKLVSDILLFPLNIQGCISTKSIKSELLLKVNLKKKLSKVLITEYRQIMKMAAISKIMAIIIQNKSFMMSMRNLLKGLLYIDKIKT